MTSDFEGFSIPDFIHYIYFPILILEKEPVYVLVRSDCMYIVLSFIPTFPCLTFFHRVFSYAARCVYFDRYNYIDIHFTTYLIIKRCGWTHWHMGGW